VRHCGPGTFFDVTAARRSWGIVKIWIKILITAIAGDSDKPPLIAFVALVATKDRVPERHEVFQRLWNGAKRRALVARAGGGCVPLRP
jgi:hypothetical protein